MNNNDQIGSAVERLPKTWVRVADRLQDLILTGKLEPDMRLPPERVLCKQMGVSRTVLREAIKHLSAQGLVREITWRGTFVNRPNLPAIRKSLEMGLGWHAQAVFENLVELRRLIEVEIAGLAAVNATKAEIKDLWQNVAEMETTVNGDVRKFVNLDLAYHAGLARATHNELFVMLFDAIAAAMRNSWEKMDLRTEVRRHGVRYHKRILAAIERGKPDEARRAVRDNLESFKHDAAALSHPPASKRRRSAVPAGKA